MTTAKMRAAIERANMKAGQDVSPYSGNGTGNGSIILEHQEPGNGFSKLQSASSCSGSVPVPVSAAYDDEGAKRRFLYYIPSRKISGFVESREDARIVWAKEVTGIDVGTLYRATELLGFDLVREKIRKVAMKKDWHTPSGLTQRDVMRKFLVTCLKNEVLAHGLEWAKDDYERQLRAEAEQKRQRGLTA